MFRYKLRTLLILLAVMPPLFAIAVWSFLYERFPGIPLSLAVFSIAVVARAREAGRSPILWTVLAWVFGYAGGIAFTFISASMLFTFLSRDTLMRLPARPTAITAALCGTLFGASLALFGAGRPIQKRN